MPHLAEDSWRIGERPRRKRLERLTLSRRPQRFTPETHAHLPAAPHHRSAEMGYCGERDAVSANPVASSSRLCATKVEDLEIDFRERLQTTLSGAYRIERELGGGGMSRVFVAEERALSRRVVVKVLAPHLAAGVNFERFKHEILLTAQLQHPHILPVFTAGETEGLPYYTMPFVEGESLRVHLMRTGAMPIAAAVSILRDVARALEFAHAKGVVHRDIKPDNILLAGNTATVADFGIAKALLASHTVTLSAPRTELGIVIGTPGYMAPEQAVGDEDVEHRADLYALGCVAYEMLAGEPPFTGPVASLIRAHIVQPPPPIVTKRADVPEGLAALIERCLRKEPDHRPDSAREVLEVLDNLVSTDTRGTGAMAGAEVPTIAVLPFAIVTGEQETDHFADGLTDEVITDLSMIKTLRVISRQSAMRLKGSDKDLRTIARELGARYVLTGSVRRAGASLRITAQLVDARTDVQLWADKFHGALEDVFEIQERLSRQIVDALRLQLTPAEDRRLAERPIGDVRAYEYYLLARQEIWSFESQSLDHALQLVRRAEAIVGDNELLCVAEGLIYWQHVNVGIVPVSQYDEYLRKAEACAAKVFALNPESSKGYGLRGTIRHNRGDTNGAADDYKKALILDPNDPEALLWLGYHYAASGRPDLARALMDRLQQVDPLTSINLTMYGMVAMFDGNYPEALTWTQRSVDMDPANPTARMMHALMLAANGRRAEAVAVLDTVAGDASTMAWARLAPAMSCALRGERDELLRLMTPELRAAAEWDEIFAWWVADCFALVNETDASIDFLERAVESGFINAPWLSKYEPFLQSLRSESRFRCLMEVVRTAWMAFEP
jgi:serine/threonine protein kinase/tetratricopeptide (TPR) repeat protein